MTLAILSGEQSHSGVCVFMPLAQPHAQITTMAMCVGVRVFLCVNWQRELDMEIKWHDNTTKVALLYVFVCNVLGLISWHILYFFIFNILLLKKKRVSCILFKSKLNLNPIFECIDAELIQKFPCILRMMNFIQVKKSILKVLKKFQQTDRQIA